MLVSSATLPLESGEMMYFAFSRVSLATHIPAEIDDASEIALDTFAPRHGDADDE